MSSIPKPENGNSTRSLRCSICRNKIKDIATCHQSPLTYGIACPVCYKRFSEDDLEVVSNLLFAYGGYFGKYKNSKFSLFNALAEVIGDVQDTLDTDDMNFKLLHRALLNGITPHQYIVILKNLLED